MNVWLWLVVWLAVSVPVGIAVGRFIRGGTA